MKEFAGLFFFFLELDISPPCKAQSFPAQVHVSSLGQNQRSLLLRGFVPGALYWLEHFLRGVLPYVKENNLITILWSSPSL